MKLNRFTFLALLIFSTAVFGQTARPVYFKTGAITVEKNITARLVDSFNVHALAYGGRSFAVVQFEKIPAGYERKILSSGGIELLEYLPDGAYTVSISRPVQLSTLLEAGAIALFQPSPKQKMDPRLAAGNIPSSSVKTAGTVDVWISFPKTFSANEVTARIRELSFDLRSSALSAYRILHLRIAAGRLDELASYPFVEYVQPAPAGDQPLNFNSRIDSRANVLSADIANGGRALNGEGVTIGVGDNADVQTHIDFAGRLINRAADPVTAAHGQHTTGTTAGAGNGNELFRGYAPKSTIVSQNFNGIILNAGAYVNDYGMVITNNSYGDNIECSYYGYYDLYSRLLDQMAFDYPQLENVFSAGNSGTSTCAPFLPGYHTVLGGYQSAKNVITVGATTDSGLVAAFSSRGPVRDGRLKPEIMTMGQGVASSWPTNIYSFNNGTSMAAPAVSGGLALLYQRYRQLNGGANPKNGLMKAIVVNGASDRGNTGPDYQYGFGWMNLLRSVDMIEKAHYFTGNSTNGSANTHAIAVPANTAQLKVMLYWNDPAASVLSAKSLVNDLDLELSDPASVTMLPEILDTSNANVGNTAVSGADHLNNIEQVVINNPSAGNYTVKVKGTAITQNPSQEYFVVYDIVPVQLKLTSPIGGEAWAPTSTIEMMKISWEANGFTSGTLTIDYSTDNGASWINISNNVDINRGLYSWWVPNVATSQALVRIVKNGSGETSVSNPFTIVGQPVVSLAPTQCEGYMNVNWTSVAGAGDYEVMMLQGDEMKPVAITAANNYTIAGLSKDSVYWVTVRARVNGKPGRRPMAVSRQPNNGSCAGSISDNDVKIDAILSPVSGRKFTSTQLSASAPVSIRIKNLDDAPVSNFTVKYSINGGSFVTENVSATIAAGGVYTHTFAAAADLSAVGNYSFVFVVKNSVPDPVAANDTARTLVKQLDNQPLNLGSYFVDNMESAAPSDYERDTMGLNGLPRYDFSRTTIYGRLRTFINTGIAYSGTKALTLDANRYFPSGNTSYLYGTFNLASYNALSNDLRLDFQYLNHGQQPHPNNKVWIRGSDTQPWIEVYDLDDNQNDPGLYKKSSSIELSDALAAAAQPFTTSFQVRWGQWGQIAATDKENAGGYSFDDVRVYEVFNDLQMRSIDAPVSVSCGLTNATQVKVSVRNSANTTISNIPVRYRINNGTWIVENIPSIAGNATIQYSFATPANFAAIGTYSLQAVVDYAADSFHDNDTASVTVVNAPVVNSFPYLQNFESGNGNWYAAGKRSSWEFGTPASVKINRAASGARAWKTRLAGNYNDLEYSYLYSPCFDLTGIVNPTLSFSVALDLEDCGAQLCDGAWVEYSADGVNWLKLGAAGNGTNWYNQSTDQLWSVQNYTNWHVATIPLPAGLNRLRLRFVMQSDPATNREGIAIDDIHVYSNTNGIYDGPTMGAPVTQPVSGNNKIDFIASGKLVASILPNNQSLGATAVQAYINAGPVRFTNTQYYGDRNLTIKPANNAFSDSVTVRFYFLDKEVDSLIKASGCATCVKPSSAYELGVSKYSDPDDSFENGSVDDDNQGIWTFLPSQAVAIVPFDKGYYAEFKVKDLSEFWLNNGGFDRSSPLPVKLLDFTAQKSGADDVLLKWKTGSETNVARYEIEFARGDADLQANHFVKIGEVASQGNSSASHSYSFTDNEPDKFGPRYYRLKVVNLDGSFVYSPVRAVIFGDAVRWHIYPNPSHGFFSLVYQVNANESFHARVLDAKGSLVREYHTTGNGFLQKLVVDLTLNASGVYLLETEVDGKKQSFKLFKQ